MRAKRADQVSLRRLLGDARSARSSRRRARRRRRSGSRSTPRGDDARRARDRLGVADRRAAELEDDHEPPSSPQRTISSAFSTDAPAAPRIDVVSHRDELDVEERIGTHAPDDDRHAAAGVDLAARLRPIRLRRRRRARRSGALGSPRASLGAPPVGDRTLDVASASRVRLELDRHADRVTMLDRNAIGVRADRESALLDRRRRRRGRATSGSRPRSSALRRRCTE